MMLFGSILDTECFRSWAPADDFLTKTVHGVDKAVTAIIGDGQKGMAKSHGAHFENALLRACTRHRAQDLSRSTKAGKLGRQAYEAAVKATGVEQVSEIIRRTRIMNDNVAKFVFDTLPLEVQFPACAVGAGKGPVYGRDTENDAEVIWPMCKQALLEPVSYRELHTHV